MGCRRDSRGSGAKEGGCGSCRGGRGEGEDGRRSPRSSSEEGQEGMWASAGGNAPAEKSRPEPNERAAGRERDWRKREGEKGKKSERVVVEEEREGRRPAATAFGGQRGARATRERDRAGAWVASRSACRRPTGRRSSPCRRGRQRRDAKSHSARGISGRLLVGSVSRRGRWWSRAKQRRRERARDGHREIVMGRRGRQPPPSYTSLPLYRGVEKGGGRSSSSGRGVLLFFFSGRPAP